MRRRNGLVFGFALALAAACAPTPAPVPAASEGAGGGGEKQPGMGTDSEFRDSHHARLQGVVVNGRGEPLGEVEVVTWALTDPQMGSLAQNRAVTDASGRFFLPVGMIAAAGTDTATVRVVVRATAFAPRYPRPTPGTYYTAEATVPVRVGPANLEPAVAAPVRLVVPVP